MGVPYCIVKNKARLVITDGCESPTATEDSNDVWRSFTNSNTRADIVCTAS